MIGLVFPMLLAHAGFTVAPPPWQESPKLAEDLVKDLQEETHFGGLKIDAGGSAFVNADAGAALYVFTADAKGAEVPAKAVRAEVDALRTGGGQEVSWKEGTEGKAVTVDREVLHQKEGTRQLMHAAIWLGTDGVLHRVSVECALRDDAAADVVDACKKAMDSLQITDPQLVALGTLPATEEPAPPPPPAPVATSAAASSTVPPGPIVVVKDKPSRWTGYFIVGGVVLVVLAVAGSVLGKKRKATA